MSTPDEDLDRILHALPLSRVDLSDAVVRVRARVAELEAELRSIADAKYTAWDDGYNTPQDFVAWVQNRCRFLLKR